MASGMSPNSLSAPRIHVFFRTPSCFHQPVSEELFQLKLETLTENKRMSLSWSDMSGGTLFLLFAAADGAGGLGSEQNHLSVPVADHGPWATAMNNLGILPVGISGQPLVSGILLFDG